MKKILFILIIMFITIIIYMVNVSENIYYFSMCNNKYDNLIKDKVDNYYNFYQTDNRINDIVNAIDDNIKIDSKSIKNILIKANIIVLDSTTNELKNKHVKYSYINSYLNNLDILLNKIRLISKEKIYILGINNLNNSTIDTSYYNQRLKLMLSKYNMEYVDTTKGKINEKIYKIVDF